MTQILWVKYATRIFLNFTIHCRGFFAVNLLLRGTSLNRTVDQRLTPAFVWRHKSGFTGSYSEQWNPNLHPPPSADKIKIMVSGSKNKIFVWLGLVARVCRFLKHAWYKIGMNNKKGLTYRGAVKIWSC